jgi:GntR family transcriptional regulator/MocR family aminotransferase
LKVALALAIAGMQHLATMALQREVKTFGAPTEAVESHISSGAAFPLAIANMTISDSSPVPIYEQICRAIRTAVATGDLPPGTHLPTGRELAEMLNIGRNTVVTAYSRLVADGYLLTNKRRGTRVVEDTANLGLVPGDEGPAKSLAVSEAKSHGSRSESNVIEIGYHARHALQAAPPETVANAPFCLYSPDPALYPRNPLSRLLTEEFCRSPSGGDNRGEIRKFQLAITNYLRRMRGVCCEPYQIIPVSGLESALDLTTRVMIDPGHWIYVEDPTSDLVRHRLRSAGAQLAPIPSDNKGVDIGRMAAPPPRMIFASPSVSFPLGQEMSEAHRQTLLGAARNWHAVIFECDTAWDLSYTGNRFRALQGSDHGAPIIYFGSLNLILGPHIQVGYLVVPAQLADPFRHTAKLIGYGPEAFVLSALARFINDTEFAIHTKNVRSAYAKRLRVLVESIRARIGRITVVEPTGGLHVTVLFSDELNEERICQMSAERGLSVAALSRFYCATGRGPASTGIVLGIGSVPDRTIESMVGRLAEVVGEVRRHRHAATAAT